MRISKWGNSLAVRIPRELVDGAGLAEGAEVKLAWQRPDTLVLSRAERQEAVEWLRQFRGRMPADYRFDRDEANAR